MDDFEAEILAFICKRVSELFGAQDACAQTHIDDDLGLTSVNVVRLIGEIEDEFDFDIDFMGFYQNKTLGEEAAFVAGLV